MEQITIAGQSFNVPVRYEEGHELTAGEASALNQTFHENIRNNMAKKIKEAQEAGNLDVAAMQTEIDNYAQSYQFGVRTGGATRDPVMSEALRIAKSKITAALKANGKKVGDVDASALTEAAKNLISQDPAIMDLARQRVAETQSLATGDLSDLIASIPAKAEGAGEQPQG